MQPYPRSVFDLFDGKRRYAVPLFQRQYVWNREEQWEPLWEDIQRKLFERLDNKNGPPHFLGAMVIDQKRFYGNQVPTQLVVDGQQRLATFQIFLAALRDVCADGQQQALADECQQYLLNRGIMDQPDIEQYKFWPTKWDRDQFKDVIDSRSRAEVRKRHPLVWRKYARKAEPLPIMIECYLYFYDQMQALLQDEEIRCSIEKKLQTLYEVLRGNLQVVTVELEGNDDPQVIFETLNARGQPLLPSDLLRNFIFWRASQNGEAQEQLYEKYWVPFDDDFWKTVEKQGRLFRPRCDLFLQHYLAFRRAEEVNIGHLYAEYKYWILTAKPFATVKDELEEMTQHREFFRRLIEPQPAEPLGRLAQVLKIFDIRTIYPLLLGLLDRSLPDKVLQDILIDLESYVVRRAICGLTTKNYNRLFLAILGKLPKAELTRATFRNILLGLQGDTSMWPRDEDFRGNWLREPIYDALGGSRVEYILQAIEGHMHSVKSEVITIDSSLTVEHILPQDWLEHWPLPGGHTGIPLWERYASSHEDTTDDRKADVEASHRRDRMLHTLGNLTLLTQALNGSVSNGPYAEKRPEILKQSALTLNRYFQDIPDWNEQRIEKRGEQLFEAARVIWPHGA